ncbi:MAG: MBL fold metallo-hydrolase [Halobacteriaceae archaeon]
MTHSTWGDWFVREEIEAADPEGLSAWYLGCNGFALRTAETTVYVDPYFGTGRPPRLLRMSAVPMRAADATRCDAVLVTHEHLDHMHPPSYEPLVEELGADLYAPPAAYERPDCEVSTDGFEDRYHEVSSGDAVTVDDLTVHVGPADDPDSHGAVSYVVEHESGTFFHGGDTRPTPAFADLGERFDVDAGVLAFGSVGRRYYPDAGETRASHVYMDENQVVEVANALGVDRLLPTHHSMWKGLDGDPKVLHEHAASFAYPRSVEPIKLGDRVDLGTPGIRPLRTLDR